MSLARLVEFMVLLRLSKYRHCLSISFSFLAVLYVGAFLLLTTGRIGMFGLCNFSCAFNVGEVGFFSVGI
jgi:hypothetical protein